MLRAQARYLQQLEEAAASGAPAPPVQEVVDLVWSMAIGGHLRPHACRTVLDAAAAAGVDLCGPQMDAVNAHKLVQARHPQGGPLAPRCCRRACGGGSRAPSRAPSGTQGRCSHAARAGAARPRPGGAARDLRPSGSQAAKRARRPCFAPDLRPRSAGGAHRAVFQHRAGRLSARRRRRAYRQSRS